MLKQLLKHLNTCWSGNIRHGYESGIAETNLAPSSALWQSDHVPTLQQTSKRCNRPSRSSTKRKRNLTDSDSRKMESQTGEHSRWAFAMDYEQLWTNMIEWTWGKKWFTRDLLGSTSMQATSKCSKSPSICECIRGHIEKRGTHPPPN
jgi:hypothetical protein